VSDESDGAFRRLFAATAVSNIGDGIHLTALPLLTVTLTRDPRLVSLIAVVGMLPVLVFGLLAGGIVDRVDRRSLLVRVDVARLAVVVGLVVLVATKQVRFWQLLVVSFALGVGETLFDTGAQAYLPSVVSGKRLAWANGRLQSARIVGNALVGPAVGGVTFAAWSSLPFALNAVSFAGIPALLGRRSMSVPSTDAKPSSSMWSDIVEGLRFLRGHRSLRTLALAVGAWNLVGTLAEGVFVLYATDVLGLGSRGYGLLISATSIGGVASALLASRAIERFGQRAVLHLAIGSFGVLHIPVAFTSNVVIAGTCFFLVGLTAYAWNVVSSSLRQTLIPDEYLGRVISAYMVIAGGTTPVCLLLGGVLAKWLGFRPLFAVSGVSMMIVAAAAWRPLARTVADAEALVVSRS
jgi:MFS family permease